MILNSFTRIFFIIFTIILVNGVIYGLLLLVKKNNYIANRIFSFIIIYSALREVLFLLVNILNFKQLQILVTFLRAVDFTIGPLLLLYMYTILYFKLPTLQKSIIASIPAIANIITYCIRLLFIGNTKYTSLLLWIQINFYIVLSFILYLFYQKKIRNYYSNIEKLKLVWLKIMIFVMFCISIISIIKGMGQNPYLQIIYELLLTSTILITWYFSLNHPQLFNKIKHIQPNSRNTKHDKYHKTALKKDILKQYSDLIYQSIFEEKMFLEPDLSIYDVSKETGLAEHHISQTINSTSNLNFFNYINSFRINEAKTLLTEFPINEKTILEIALESGFGSKSQFNRVFKEAVGKTPSEFRRV